MVGNFLVAPAVDVELENSSNNFRFCGDDLELLLFVHDVAVGGGADPFSVLLAALDNRFHFFAGVGDGHLVDDESELDFQPIVVVREVHVLPDGNDTDSGVPEVFQFHQAAAVPAGETGEVLDDEDILFVAHQLPPHGLVVLPLFEGVARAVPVLVEGQGTAWEFLLYEVRDDGLLVFDGGVVPIQLLIYRDAAVSGNIKAFNHGSTPLCQIASFFIPY